MKASFAFLFLLIFSFKGFAQFEQPKKTLKIAPVTTPSGQVAPTSSKSITYPSIFDKKDKLVESVSLLKKKPEPEKSIMEKEQFENPGKLYEKRVEKLEKDVASEYITENYGRFKSKTKRIKILCRDYDAVDSDMIRILLDNNQVYACTLAADNTLFYLDLPSNVNVIDFYAVNEGFGSPNTAEFTILDENDTLIYTGKWALNVGYRARIVIDK